MKNNRGITLIALVFTVILLAILVGVTVNMGVGITASAKFENIETHLLLIQSKTKIMSQNKAIGEITEEELRGTKQTSGDYNGWYLLSQSELNEMGVSGAKANDGYYVDYETDDIAYGAGVSIDGLTFHKLSDMLEYNKK